MTSTPWAYQFERFELRPQARQLIGPQGEIELQAKVFDLLLFLLQHPAVAIDKNAILDAVWPRQSVSEAALARCVMKLRRALGDDASEPRIVQTLHGHGYRFGLPVTAIERAPEATQTASDESPLAKPSAPASESRSDLRAAASRRRFPLRVVGVILALSIAAIAMWMSGVWRSSEEVATRPTRVAILPISNETGDASLDWAGLALMGAIGDVVHFGDGVALLSPSEVMSLQPQLAALSPTEQRDWLQDTAGVTHLLIGRLLSQPGQLRLSYRVISPNGEQRRRTVVANEVSSLAHAAGADLRVVLGSQRQGGQLIDDTFANEAFMRGKALRLQGDIKAASDYFKLAMDQAPGAFWPRYEWALCLRDLGQSSEAQGTLEQLKGEADANQALEPRLSVRNALGILDWRAGRYERAEALLQEALVLAEQKADQDRIASVLTNLGILADYRHQPDRARDYLHRASVASLASGLDRPPGNIHHTLAQIELGEGRLDQAEHHLLAALEQFRRIGNRRFEATTLNSMSRLRRRQGRWDEARQLIDQALAMHRESGNRGAEASALLASAAIEAERGQIGHAIELAHQSKDVAEAVRESPRIALALRLEALFERDRGQYEQAKALFQQAGEIYTAAKDRNALLRIELEIAEVERRQGELVNAAKRLAELESSLSPGSSLRQEWQAATARIARDQGDVDRAAALIGPATTVETDSTRLLRADLMLDQTQPLAAQETLSAIDESERRQPAYWVVKARLDAAQGALDEALASEQMARKLAGERWLEADQTRLEMRQAAIK